MAIFYFLLWRRIEEEDIFSKIKKQVFTPENQLIIIGSIAR